ncbi:MAG: cytoplasmic protein [Kiritimatiellia bacterium]
MQKQFENLRASELYCPRCRCSRRVREKLLLVLPHGAIHSYQCSVCGETLGTKNVKEAANRLVT